MKLPSLQDFTRSAAAATVLATAAPAADAALYEFSVTGTASRIVNTGTATRPPAIFPAYFDMGDQLTLRFTIDTDLDTDLVEAADMGGFQAITSAAVSSDSFAATSLQTGSIFQSKIGNNSSVALEGLLTGPAPTQRGTLFYSLQFSDTNGAQDGKVLFSDPNTLISSSNLFNSLSAGTMYMSIEYRGRTLERLDLGNLQYSVKEVNAVPLPPTSALMLSGLAVLGGVLARRKKAETGAEPAPQAA